MTIPAASSTLDDPAVLNRSASRKSSSAGRTNRRSLHQPRSAAGSAATEEKRPPTSRENAPGSGPVSGGGNSGPALDRNGPTVPKAKQVQGQYVGPPLRRPAAGASGPHSPTNDRTLLASPPLSMGEKLRPPLDRFLENLDMLLDQLAAPPPSPQAVDLLANVIIDYLHLIDFCGRNGHALRGKLRCIFQKLTTARQSGAFQALCSFHGASGPGTGPCPASNSTPQPSLIPNHGPPLHQHVHTASQTLANPTMANGHAQKIPMTAPMSPPYGSGVPTSNDGIGVPQAGPTTPIGNHVHNQLPHLPPPPFTHPPPTSHGHLFAGMGGPSHFAATPYVTDPWQGSGYPQMAYAVPAANLSMHHPIGGGLYPGHDPYHCPSPNAGILPYAVPGFVSAGIPSLVAYTPQHVNPHHRPNVHNAGCAVTGDEQFQMSGIMDSHQHPAQSRTPPSNSAE